MDLNELRENCIILAHNYQIPEIQDIADYVGDSLQLCQEAAKVDKDYILFCGVDFMAESAVMLNPEKTVLMPDLDAKCPMAAMLPAERLIKAKHENPNATTVLYINTHIGARAESDVTCTSANAVKIVKALEADEILFGPDANLAWHVARHIPEKKIIPIPPKGHCRTHILFEKEDVLLVKEQYPDAEVLIHPECKPEVQMLADHVMSTGQMIRQVKESDSKKFIIGTETGIIHRMKKEAPDKMFIPALETAACENMKKHTMEKVLKELKERKNIVTVDPRLAEKAKKSLERILEMS